MANPSTSYGPQIVANTAIDLVTTNWATVCDAAWLKAMGAPNLPAPIASNCYTSRRALFTAESQPKIGLSVIRTDSVVTDALGAMDQVHELEIAVCSDWGYYDGGGVHPLVEADPGDDPIAFTPEVYETALRAYVEGVVMILTSPVWGFPNLDARNRFTVGWPGTGIYNSAPGSGITAQDFVIGQDETGQTIIQEPVRASIQVFQRRSLAR